MKLFLYSDFCGIKTDTEILKNNFDFDMSSARVLFVPYADKTYTTYKNRIKEKLYSLGITKGNITEITKKTELFRFDFKLIVVSGGNSLRLIHYLKKYNQYDYLKELINKGIPYIGDSAGSVVVGNDIKYTEQYEPLLDKVETEQNEIYKSLNLVDKVVLAHTTKRRLNHETNEVYDDELYYGYYLKYKKPLEEKPHISIGNNEFVFVNNGVEEKFIEDIEK